MQVYKPTYHPRSPQIRAAKVNFNHPPLPPPCALFFSAGEGLSSGRTETKMLRYRSPLPPFWVLE